MAKVTISARIDEELYNYYKELEIPLTMVIEAGLLDFAHRDDKIAYLDDTLQDREKRDLDSKVWKEYLRYELSKFNLPESLEGKILENDKETIATILALRKLTRG